MDEEPFNTVAWIRMELATFWGRPGGTDPYEGASQLNRACLRDEDRVTLADAQYVVFSSLTPIAWKLGDGRWMVPAHQYSDLACKHTETTLAALSHLDVRPENLNLLQP